MSHNKTVQPELFAEWVRPTSHWPELYFIRRSTLLTLIPLVYMMFSRRMASFKNVLCSFASFLYFSKTQKSDFWRCRQKNASWSGKFRSETRRTFNNPGFAVQRSRLLYQHWVKNAFCVTSVCTSVVDFTCRLLWNIITRNCLTLPTPGIEISILHFRLEWGIKSFFWTPVSEGNGMQHQTWRHQPRSFISTYDFCRFIFSLVIIIARFEYGKQLNTVNCNTEHIPISYRYHVVTQSL